MIKTFTDKRTAALFSARAAKGIPADVSKRAAIKLMVINAAGELQDLPAPPGNHLEALRDDRIGQHSIRVNTPWRICFVWREGDAYDVEFCDYH